ncbi:MAG: exosortase C-terminal domain/associated protein EpsI [bacterium]
MSSAQVRSSLSSERRFIIILVLVGLAIIARYGLSRSETSINRKPLTRFPQIIEDWKAIDEQYIDKNSMAVLLVDDYLMRTYMNEGCQTSSLYIGYFKTQREGKQIHSPRQCLPGAGWTLLEHTKYQLPLMQHNPSRIPVNLYLMRKGSEKLSVVWWYQGRGRIYNNEWLNKLYMTLDSVVKGRTDGALVRVITPVTCSAEQTIEDQTRFINNFFPLLREYIPD